MRFPKRLLQIAPGIPPKNTKIVFFRHEKTAQTKTFESGYFRWGRGLPCEGVGAKKFGMSLKTREIKLFGRDFPGFCWDIPVAPEKFEKKVCVQFWPLIVGAFSGIPLRIAPGMPPKNTKIVFWGYFFLVFSVSFLSLAIPKDPDILKTVRVAKR